MTPPNVIRTSRLAFKNVTRVVFARKLARRLRLIHLVHQILNLVRSHGHAAEHTHFQAETHDKHTKPARKGQDTLPIAARATYRITVRRECLVT